MGMEKLSMAVLAEKLGQIAGPGKLEDREWRIRNRLRWHDKAKSAVRHLLNGEQRADLEETLQIEAAYALWCVDKIEAIPDETAKLIAAINEFAERAARVDPEFFRPTVEALRARLYRLGQPEPRAHRAHRRRPA